MSTSTPYGCVISDLHYLSNRAAFDRYKSAIREQLAGAEVVVLNGDIFDFRWRGKRSLEQSLDEAELLLREIVSWSPASRVCFVVGNHDSHPQFLHRLEKLSQSCERFEWEFVELIIDSNLFIHGDILHVQSRNELEKYRAEFHDERVIYAQLALPYKYIHHLRVPRLILKSHSINRHVAHLDGLLQSGVIGNSRRITDVFFGHTHKAFADFEYNQRRYHNTGGVLIGIPWCVHRFRIDSRRD